MDYLENGIQLLLIMLSLLVSLFRYINTKKRGWLYAVGFFTSSLLSSYFWTAYLIIMGDSPTSSDLFTYLGWNVSYFILALLTIHMKSIEESRYFNPIMLLPIPLNIWQLHLYLQFGAALNNLYQVTVCTFVSCSCLQSLLWYARNRKKGAKFPYLAVSVLIYVTSEFGMWTASCFEGWAIYAYYLFSFLCSASYIVFLWAIRAAYEGDSKDDMLIDSGIQSFLKVSYVALVTVCSVGGVVLGGWIRDVLTRSANVTNENEVYKIITVILFLISLVLAAVAIAIMLIVYYEQKITENSRLREEKQVAERSNAAKSDFLANMSHEIRTPLNAVLGMNKMIVLDSFRARDHLPEDREQIRKIFSEITEYAGNIESAGNNLLSIINDILDFSKIEAGKLDLTEHEYQLSAVLNDVSNIVMFRAKDKNIAFQSEIDENVPDHLYGDDMRIRQIISNMLSNAVKYTDSGSITLSVHGAGKYQAGESAELVIAVRDTGIGIRKEALNKIFDKFERTDLERNNTVEGTGLGLAITHRLLDMMGGSIYVESEYGKGSVFTILLPQKVISVEPIGNFHEKFEASIQTQHASEDLFRAPEACILIVDDTRMNLSVVAGLLKDTEIQMDTADSGAEALRLCKERCYDLILLDQRMPVMDGTETLHRLRAQEDSASVNSPVICLTADALSGAKEHYLSEGFQDYLSKPIDSRALKQMLIQYLPSDKILPVMETPQQDVQSKPDDGLYAALQQLGIDTGTGLGYCQKDDELYRILLHEFVQGAAQRKRDLQRYFDTHDAKNYGILVHSLKSSSRTIGAMTLSGIAAKLEKSADADRWDILTENHFMMLRTYDDIVHAIEEAAGTEPATVPVSVADEDEILEFFPENCRP